MAAARVREAGKRHHACLLASSSGTLLEHLAAEPARARGDIHACVSEHNFFLHRGRAGCTRARSRKQKGEPPQQLQCSRAAHPHAHVLRQCWQPLASCEPPPVARGCCGRSSRSCDERGRGHIRTENQKVQPHSSSLASLDNLTLVMRSTFTLKMPANAVYRTRKSAPRAFRICAGHRQTPRGCLSAAGRACGRVGARLGRSPGEGRGLKASQCERTNERSLYNTTTLETLSRDAAS